MNFDLDDEQRMLHDLVARFVDDRNGAAQRAEARATPEGFSRSNWQALAELGLLAVPFGEAEGGLNGGAVEMITVAEAFGRGLSTEPWLTDIFLAARLLERAGSAAQRAAWLPGIIAGEQRLALAHCEHAARFNALSVRCEARDGRLSGAKTFVLGGAGADGFIVSARARGAADDADGLSLWLVEAAADGLVRRDYRLVDGSVATELTLHRVAGERLDGGAAALLAQFDEARLIACAEMLGIMDMLFAATLEHVRTRRQFGAPLGSFQVIQHRMADLYVACEQARSQLLRAALHDDGPAPRAAVAGAKSFIAANALVLGEACIQLHGGMGTTEELAIGHGHKRILVLAMLLGDAEAELARYMKLAA